MVCLLSRIITKIKHLFIVVKIFLDISILISFIKLPVSLNNILESFPHLSWILLNPPTTDPGPPTNRPPATNPPTTETSAHQNNDPPTQ